MNKKFTCEIQQANLYKKIRKFFKDKIYIEKYTVVFVI